MDNTQLLKHFQAGEQHAFKRVFDMYYQPLCLFIVKMGLDKAQAEEIAHDVFMKLWERPADFDTLEGIRGFLYVSCKNAALNLIDKYKRLQVKQDKFLAEQEWVDTPVYQQMIYVETLHAIHQAIAKLPDRCGQIMQLLFVEGDSPQEVAEKLEISRATVYNQKMRGIALLKDLLDPEQIFMLLFLFTGF